MNSKVLAAIVAVLLLGAATLYFTLRLEPQRNWHDPESITLEVVDKVTEKTAVPVKEISPDEAYKNMRANDRIVLLDVRTQKEYQKERIPGAILLTLEDAPVFGPKVEKLIPDKNATVYLFCRTGRRSHAAATIMMNRGYKDVYNMGGIIDWKYDIIEN